jgi:hypothetical protein
MKKLMIALGLIFILAATTFPSWGKDKVIYVCYLDKKQQARVVKKTRDCQKSEMAIALNKIEPNTATDQEISERAQEVAGKYPTWPMPAMFEGESVGIGGIGGITTSP